MKKIDFETPIIRIKADIIVLIILTISTFVFILYNCFLPNNTIIECDKSIDECKITYSNLFKINCVQKDIVFKISNIEDIEFDPPTIRYPRANINVIVKNIENNNINRGIIMYPDILSPSIDEEDTKILTNRMSNFINSTNNIFYFDRTNDINKFTRIGYIIGILIYYIIALIMILFDINYYKKKSKFS